MLEAPTISHLDLDQRLDDDKNDIKIIDVRDLDYFIGHIPGASHVPSPTFADNVSEIAKQLSTGKTMCVINCLTGEKRASTCARQLLKHLEEQCPGQGRNVCVLKGGFAAWEKHFGSKNRDGRYISRKLNLDGYSLHGFPNKGKKRMVKFNHAIQSASSATQPVSDGVPSQDVSAERTHWPEIEPVQESNTLPSEDTGRIDAWRQRLSVGDEVQTHSRSTGEWVNAVVLASNDKQVTVSYIQENKARIKIVPLKSLDLLPKSNGMSQDSATEEQYCVEIELNQDSSTMAAKGDAHIETWRLQLSAGDEIQMHSRSTGQWVNGVISASDSKQVTVSYFQGSKVRIKTLPLTSVDLQPKVGKILNLANPHVSSVIQDEIDDDDGSWNWSSEGSNSSIQGNWSSEGSTCSLRGNWSSDSEGSTASHQTKPCSQSLSSKEGSSSASSLNESESPEIPYMSQTDLARRLGQENLQIIDVRGVDYFMGHITGARNVPFAFFEDQLEDLAKDFAVSGKKLVFHCGESRHRGPQCARRFVSYLGDNFPMSNCTVYILKGGFQSWAQCCSGSDNIGQYIQVPGLASGDFRASAPYLLPIRSEETLPSPVMSQDALPSP